MASHGNVLIINSDAQFKSEFEKHSNKLLIVDFTASWQVLRIEHIFLVNGLFLQMQVIVY